MRKIAFTVDVEKDFHKESYANLKNLSKLSKTLKARNIKATFFATSDCLEKYPGIFKKLRKEGHEVALHGYLHERWDVLSLEEREERLHKAIAVYRGVFNENPKGFRAPQFSADFELVKLLNKMHFAYDSSLVQFPLFQAIFFPSRLGLYLRQCFIRPNIRGSKMRIWEIFVSSFVLPTSAFSLRKLPRWLFWILHEFAYLYRKKNWVIFLSHSYEFDKAGLERIESYLEKYKNASFVRMEDLVA